MLGSPLGMTSERDGGDDMRVENASMYDRCAGFFFVDKAVIVRLMSRRRPTKKKMPNEDPQMTNCL